MAVETEGWDVIVVGARCAGAALAALVAKRGLRVLLLEASPRGTDMPLSTHYIQPPGMDVLDELGLGDRARAAAPPTKKFRFALDDVEATIDLLAGREGYCVRRSLIDTWLQETAETHGATFLDGHRVVDLVRDGDRVVGVVARTKNDSVTFRGSLVVGADGPHSTVAKKTGVEEYLVTEGDRSAYWAYYPAPKAWAADWDATLEHKGDDIRYVFRTSQNQVILVYCPPRATADSWGREHAAKLDGALRGSEATRALLGDGVPVGKPVGLLRPRFFYRRAVGPGFALVGDAGHFKDYVTGQGMADALLDARRLAQAIVDGREQALEHYWRLRDVETLPLHFDAIQQGEVGFNGPLMRLIIGRMGRDAALASRVFRVANRDLSPAELVPLGAMVRMVLAAVLRGQTDVLPGFLAAGKRGGEEAAELERRKQLLVEARARLDAAPPRPRRVATPIAAVA